ncbi:MmpS family transport accessory protein [Catenuloplanes sp. NPDC051500]|uniref:MmpS family transport accessory protein n=1 Tax=Catenuloplanes sp. NPDC051500 TaxID=3363959 RepID=UPI00379313B9
MTEPNPPSPEQQPSNPWARPPEGAPEQQVSYAPPAPPPTASWGYQPYQQTSAPPQARPPRSLTPIIAVIVAAVILLCVGTAVAGVLVLNQARDAVSTTPDPTPPVETESPEPTRAPRTDDPFPLPTGLPGLPEDLIPSSVAIPADADATVVYEVTGEGSAAITFTQAGRPTVEGVAELPWRKEFTLGTETPLLNVTGIRFGTTSAELTCRILLDGKEVTKRSATGTTTTASCAQIVVVS